MRRPTKRRIKGRVRKVLRKREAVHLTGTDAAIKPKTSMLKPGDTYPIGRSGNIVAAVTGAGKGWYTQNSIKELRLVAKIERWLATPITVLKNSPEYRKINLELNKMHAEAKAIFEETGIGFGDVMSVDPDPPDVYRKKP